MSGCAVGTAGGAPARDAHAGCSRPVWRVGPPQVFRHSLRLGCCHLLGPSGWVGGVCGVCGWGGWVVYCNAWWLVGSTLKPPCGSMGGVSVSTASAVVAQALWATF